MPSDFWDDEEFQRDAVFSFRKPGAEITGNITYMEKVEFGEGDDRRAVPVLTLTVEDGETVLVRCGPKNLRLLLQEIRPVTGQDIRIKFTREEPLRGPGNRTEMHWLVDYQGHTYTK